MEDFTELAYRNKLIKLSNHPQSIEGLSHYIQRHTKHKSNIIKIWIKELKNERDHARIINLLYVANDVIQNCRKTVPQLKEDFFPVLEHAFKFVARLTSNELRRTVNRLLVIWKDREIFLPAQIKSLEDALKHKKPEDTSFPAPVSAKSSFSDDPRNFDLVEEETQSCAKMMLEGFTKLEKPASVEKDIRDRIARFPGAVACKERLHHIKTSEQVQHLLRQNEEVTPLIKDYCEQLEKEKMERQSLQNLFDRMIENIQKCSEHTDRMLKEVKKKEERLKGELLEVEKAYNSLPDMDAPRISEALPTLENLFDL